MPKFKSFSLILLMLATLLSTPACNTSKGVKGAAIGGSLGGIIGGTIAKGNNKTKGILIGAAIGGAAGAVIGRYMDKQAAEIERDLEGAEVERVGEGILITFDSGLLFATNSYQINSTTRANLKELADVLKKYEDTEILIQGHTDATGGDDLNQKLSENRARSVEQELVGKGVAKGRLITMGLGETQPVASNATTAGRQQNRRVEVAIVANDKLRRAAEKGEIK